MKNIKFKIVILVFLALILLYSCAEKEVKTEEKDMDMEERTFTLEELSEYDGKDEKPAYIAIEGVVYDVTDVGQWKDGNHNGFDAGKDLTEEIKTLSPHGVSKLKKLKVMGTLVDK